MNADEYILKIPDRDDEEAVMAYRRALIESGSETDGTSLLAGFEDYGSWLAFVQETARKESAGWGPAQGYLVYRKQDRLLAGMCDLRFCGNEKTVFYFGDAGYSVHPALRNRGCGTMILKKLLTEAKHRGLSELRIVCLKENTASQHVVRHCGGRFKESFTDPADGACVFAYTLCTEDAEI